MTKQNYIDDYAEAIHNVAPPETEEWNWQPLYRYYAVLMLAKGEAVTDEDVHNAWAAWAAEHSPHSRSLVPFEALPQFVQDMDKPYTEAIHEVARLAREANLLGRK